MNMLHLTNRLVHLQVKNIKYTYSQFIKALSRLRHKTSVACDWLILTSFQLLLITDIVSLSFFLSPGSLQITWQEIMVGVESGLLMFPINILIITIFRSIRPRIISKSQKGDSEGNLRPPAVTIPTILKVCFALFNL